ncbi:MAG: BACON domain-containing protein, partial [Prevotella sp.]|nr:BACON domain-containing protein [Prevotella sp.]
TITATADANYSRESRHTFINIKAANGDFLKVNVSQLGAVFVLDAPATIAYKDAATEATYDFNTNLPVQVTTSDSWLKAKLVDGKLTINADANETGSIRSGYVIYQAGTLADKIEVVQGEMDKDIVGKYYILGGIDPDEEDPEKADVMFLTQLVKDETGAYSLDFPLDEWTLPVTVDDATLSISIAGGQPMGMWRVYNICSLIGDATAGSVTWNTAVTITGSMKVYKDEAGSFVAAEFADDGKWSGKVSDCFSLGAFTSTTYSSSTFAGTLAFFTNVYLQEYNLAAGAPKMAKRSPAQSYVLKTKYSAVK